MIPFQKISDYVRIVLMVMCAVAIPLFIIVGIRTASHASCECQRFPQINSALLCLILWLQLLKSK